MNVTSTLLPWASQTVAAAILNAAASTNSATTTTTITTTSNGTTTTTSITITNTTAATPTTTTSAPLPLPVEELPLTVRVALSLVLAVAVVMAVVGNGVVCVLVYRKAAMRSAINLLVAQLALSDLLLGLLVLPSAVVGMFLDSPSSSSSSFSSSPSSSFQYPRSELCALGSLLQETLVTVNMFLLLAISLDRYLIIVHRQERLNVRRARCVILLAWVLAFLAALPPLLGWGQFPAYPGHPQCPDLVVPRSSAADEAYVVLRCLLTRYFFMAAILYCYARILSAVRRKSVRVHHYAVDVGVTQGSASAAALPRPQPRISVSGALREFSSTDGEQQFTAASSLAMSTPSPVALGGGDFSSPECLLSDTVLVAGRTARRAGLAAERSSGAGGGACSKRQVSSSQNRFSFPVSSVASPTADLFSSDCFQSSASSSVGGTLWNTASFVSECAAVSPPPGNQPDAADAVCNSEVAAARFTRSSSCCLAEIHASSVKEKHSLGRQDASSSPGPPSETSGSSLHRLCPSCAKARGGSGGSAPCRRRRSYSSGSPVCFMSSNSSVYITSPLAGRAPDCLSYPPTSVAGCLCARRSSASQCGKQPVAKMPSVSPEMPSIIRRRLNANALKLPMATASCRCQEPALCHGCQKSTDAGSGAERVSSDKSVVLLSCQNLKSKALPGDCVCSQRERERAESEPGDVLASKPTAGRQREETAGSCHSAQNPRRTTCRHHRGFVPSSSSSAVTESAGRQPLDCSLDNPERWHRSSFSARDGRSLPDNPFCASSCFHSSSSLSSNPAQRTAVATRAAVPSISSSRCSSWSPPERVPRSLECPLCLASAGGLAGHDGGEDLHPQPRTSTCLFSPARHPPRLARAHDHHHHHHHHHPQAHRTPPYLSSPSGLSPSAKGARRTAGARRQVVQDMSLRTRAFKTILILSLLLCACWAPHATAVLVTCLLGAPSPGLLCVLLWLGFAKSALNPVVYCLRIRKFRDACKETVPSSCHACCVFPPRCVVVVAKRRVNPSAVYQCTETSLS